MLDPPKKYVTYRIGVMCIFQKAYQKENQGFQAYRFHLASLNTTKATNIPHCQVLQYNVVYATSTVNR